MNGDSTITITLLIAILSFAMSAVNTVTSLKKNNKTETKAAATEMATVMVKLELIQDNMKDLKTNMRGDMSDLKKDILSIRSDMNEFRERIVAVEQKVKT